MANLDITPDWPAAQRAGRAIGAMFFAVFGGAWLLLWVQRSQPSHLLAPILIVTAAALLFLSAWLRYRANRAALAAVEHTARQQRQQRVFHIVNVAQWVLILLIGNLLNNMGLSHWVIPAAILVIGLHFLPLAKVFANPAQYLTGVALILLAALYPQIAAAGAASPVGCLGAGLILWGSAVWALLAEPRDTV